MRLAVVTHRVIMGDGQGRVNLETVQEALRQGWQVHLIAAEIAPELKVHPSVSWVPIPRTTLPTDMAHNLAFARHSARWLRQNRDRFDLLHVNGYITPVAGDVNAAHFVHSAWLKSPAHTARERGGLYGRYQWTYTYLNARWERGAYRQAKAVVAVSRRVREELLALGVPDDRIHVITNGVDLQEFAPGEADRASLGLPPGVPLALFVGDIRTSRKNLDTVLRALVPLPEMHLAVVGGTEGSPYPDMAAQLGIADRVTFLGFRRDVAQIMRAADVFVSPSRYEPFSLVLLEAMATGLPVVTAQTLGAAELVAPESGFVLESPEDAAGITDALRVLGADPMRRQRMGQKARTIAERHGWVDMARRYLNLYQQVAANKAKAV